MTNRLATLLHHVITLCEPHELGAIKLAKILWFADVEYYRRTGQLISGVDDYRKNEQGPLHRNFYDALNALKAEGAVVETTGSTVVGERREFAACSLPDVSAFSSEEIATIDRVVARIKPMSAKSISEHTHDALWEEANWNERIPVAAAAVVPGMITAEIVVWAEGELATDGHRSPA